MTDSKAFQTRWKYKNLPITYAKLVAWYAPRPIRDEAELQAATAMIDAMAGHDLNRDQDDYLDLLSTLVEAYEEKHHALKVGKMSPLEALGYLMEQNGMTAAELGKLLGERTLGSKILRGERKIGLTYAKALAKRFCVDIGLFIG